MVPPINFHPKAEEEKLLRSVKSNSEFEISSNEEMMFERAPVMEAQPKPILRQSNSMMDPPSSFRSKRFGHKIQ